MQSEQLDGVLVGKLVYENLDIFQVTWDWHRIILSNLKVWALDSRVVKILQNYRNQSSIMWVSYPPTVICLRYQVNECIVGDVRILIQENF